MAGKTDQKILRIGIIQGGKIIEERLLRKHETVTVGESTKNTFSLTLPEMPKRYPLFVLKGQVYELAFLDKMQGRISSKEGGVVDLKSLKSQKLVKKKGNAYHFPLTPDTRGKVQIGDVTFLFQFVTPPPLPAKPKLPAVARGGLIRSIDWVFATVVVLSFLGHAGGIAFAKSQPRPPEPTLEELGERFMKVIMPKKKKEAPKVESDAGKEGKTEKAAKKANKAAKKADDGGEKKAAKKSNVSDEEAARAAAQRRAEIAKRVASKGLLGILGSTGAGGGASGMNVVDVFGEGHISGDLDAAFSDVTGVGVADSVGARTSRGGGGAGAEGEIADIGALKSSGASGGGGVGTKKRATVRGSIKSTAPEVDGALDSAALQRAVRRKMGAVKACYEKQLKRNPNLSGKVVVVFVVGANGRVTSAEVDQNTMGNADVGRCIISQVKRWIFPKPEGGEDAEVVLPFIFAPAK